MRLAIVAAAMLVACSSSAPAPTPASLDTPGTDAAAAAPDASDGLPSRPPAASDGGTDAIADADDAAASLEDSGSADDAGAELVQGTFGGTPFVGKAISISALYTGTDPYFRIFAMVSPLEAGTLLIDVFPPAVGTYSCDYLAGARLLYAPSKGLDFEALGQKDATCTVTVTQLGPVGGWVDGTFTGSLLRYENDAPVASPPITATGSFHVKRRLPP